jgi:hypothetical protein
LRHFGYSLGRVLANHASFLSKPQIPLEPEIFISSIPKPKLSLAMFSMMVPSLWKYRSQFESIRMETDYFNETYIADDSGTVLQSVQPNTEGFAISNVLLPDSPPQPKGKQPRFGVSIFIYLIDIIANIMLASEYRKKTQRYFQDKPLS